MSQLQPDQTRTRPAETIDPFSACVIHQLIAGLNPNGSIRRLVSPWSDLSAAIAAAPTPAEKSRCFETWISDFPDRDAIMEAVARSDLEADLETMIAPAFMAGSDLVEIPELPKTAQLDPTLGLKVGTWLDAYVNYSELWSPRAYYGFHEACALFILSTVAARRVRICMGKERFTNLYIALTARTSLFAKSTTAEIALQTLRQAGLDWLLAADSATPQKFISDLTTRLVDNYDSLDDEGKIRAQLRVGLAGQRGWYYDEFGQHVSAMMRDGGFMSDFRGLLRRMDDTPARYEYGSIGRGSDVIERPYLALLANLTPDDLKPFARRGSLLWGDGFLARFILVTPPENTRLRDRFPAGERIIPGELITPLVEWHKRLGLPDVDISDELSDEGKPTGPKKLELSPRSPVTLEVAPEVREAFYAYHDGLLDLLDASDNHDLDGNYSRLAEKALRISGLLASIDGADILTLPYWARGQLLAEEWRAGLHRLYVQINEAPPNRTEELEEKLLAVIAKHGPSTAAELVHFIRGLSRGEASMILDGLVKAGELQTSKTSKGTNRYGFSN
jgi:hypothetical protein